MIVPVGVVILSACGVGWKDNRISEVTVGEDGRTLTVGWHCHLDASVNAIETADEVRLSFRVYDRSKGDCADAEQVTLDEPVGNRTIIDDATGKALRAARNDCYTPSPAPMGCE